MITLPPLCADEIHLYLLRLPASSLELTRLEQHLTPDEVTRASLLQCEQAKNRFIAARGIVREILGDYLGSAPSEVTLLKGEQGKPYLSGRHESLRFNLSHSGEYCLIGCSADRDIGVDIELFDSNRPLRDMARMVFSDTEQQELLCLSDSDFENAFYRCWVRKEACLKACGTGFTIPANSLNMGHSPTKNSSVISWNRKDWYVLDLDVPNSCYAAVAIERLEAGKNPPGIVRVQHYLSCE